MMVLMIVLIIMTMVIGNPIITQEPKDNESKVIIIDELVFQT